MVTETTRNDRAHDANLDSAPVGITCGWLMDSESTRLVENLDSLICMIILYFSWVIPSDCG